MCPEELMLITPILPMSVLLLIAGTFLKEILYVSYICEGCHDLMQF